MKGVVIRERSGATMETIMSVYPRHKIVVDKFIERGDVIGIGPFTGGGNMAIFPKDSVASTFVNLSALVSSGQDPASNIFIFDVIKCHKDPKTPSLPAVGRVHKGAALFCEWSKDYI